MELLSSWWGIVGGTIGGGVGIGALIWLVKKWIERFIKSTFDKELEDHKAKLQRDLQSHKNELDKELGVFQTKAEYEQKILLERKVTWHGERHKVLKETWERFEEVNYNFDNCLKFFSMAEDVKNSFKKDSKEEWERLFTFVLSTNMALEEDSEEKEKIIKEFYENGDCTIIAHFYLTKSMKTFWQFARYYNVNHLFLSPHVVKVFEEVVEYMRHIWSVEQSNRIEGRSAFGNSLDAKNRLVEWMQITNGVGLVIHKELRPDEPPVNKESQT